MSILKTLSVLGVMIASSASAGNYSLEVSTLHRVLATVEGSNEPNRTINMSAADSSYESSFMISPRDSVYMPSDRHWFNDFKFGPSTSLQITLDEGKFSQTWASGTSALTASPKLVTITQTDTSHCQLFPNVAKPQLPFKAMVLKFSDSSAREEYCYILPENAVVSALASNPEAKFWFSTYSSHHRYNNLIWGMTVEVAVKNQ